jgi:hypothetical protein
MNSLKIDNLEVSTAASYNELSRYQLLELCKQLTVDAKDLRFKLVMILLKAKRGWFKTPKVVKVLKTLPTGYMQYLAFDDAVTGWIFKPAQLSAYKLKDFKYWFTKYYGPANDILDINVAEFIEVSMYYGAYMASIKADAVKPELLDKMIAVLYRPGKWFYAIRKLLPNFELDKRQRNNTYRFEKRCAAFRNLKPEIKLAIFLQFEGAMEKFALDFPNAFGSQGEGNDTNGWIGLLMEMSNDIFGDYEKTQSVDIFTFFTKVDKNIKNAKDLKAKTEK